MNVVDFIDSRERAISSNFITRHLIGIKGNRERVRLQKNLKRETIRRFINELRIAKNPNNRNEIEKAVLFLHKLK